MTYLDISRDLGGPLKHFNRNLTKAEAWALVKLAAPLTGLALVNMTMSITDTLMTAAFGVEALAAVAVASDFYSILFYLAVGCIGGLGPLYAAAHASGDTDRLARLRTAGTITCALLAVPIAIGANCLRVFGTGIILLLFGKKYAEDAFHTLEGMVMVGLAAVLLVLTAWALARFENWYRGESEDQPGETVDQATPSTIAT